MFSPIYDLIKDQAPKWTKVIMGLVLVYRFSWHTAHSNHELVMSSLPFRAQ